MQANFDKLFKSEKASFLKLFNEITDFTRLSFYLPLVILQWELMLLNKVEFRFDFDLPRHDEVQCIALGFVNVENHFASSVDLL
jgi:hypothetical protein